MYKLRDYQVEAVEQSLWHLENYKKPFIIQAATGAGKSLIIADICHKLDEPVLILQPTKELLEQNYSKLSSYGIEDIAIYSASMKTKEVGKFTYATIGSIYKKPELFKHFKYVIIDECFVAGTKVSGKNIEDINPGDQIWAFDHVNNKPVLSTVRAVSKKLLPSVMYRVNLNDESIISTGNHPYYVKGIGYVMAKDLTAGDIVYAIEENPNSKDALQLLQATSDDKRLSSILEDEEDREDISQRVRSYKRCGGVFDTHDKKQPNEESRVEVKNECYSKEDWPQATYTGWKWSRVDKTTRKSIQSSGRRLVYGIGGEDTYEISLSVPLQDRHSEPNQKNSNRSGREQPLLSKNTRQEEGGVIREVRVESVEVHKQADIVGPKVSSKFDYVYNLEVEKYNNYFANGILVHNCHLVNPKNLDGMYTKFLNAIECTRVCGLTATPYRLQQKYFNENGQMYYTSHLKMINRIHPFFFKKIAYKIETQELIDAGYLCPIKYRSDEINWDLLEVNSTGADFTAESMEKFWNDGRLKKIALTIQMIDQNCQRNLIFCSSIRQAQRVVDMLSDIGIGSALITGDTPPNERQDAITEFKAGMTKHLVNVGVLTTGFDVPELDCITLARPTMSLALYYQMIGRGVRIDPERPDKMLRVYDFAGCVRKLGRVETIKLAKEDGWKDCVVSEVGRMDEVPLFKFKVKNNKFKEKKS